MKPYRQTRLWMLAVILLLTGCEPAIESSQSRQLGGVRQAGSSQLERALSLLNRVDEFERDQALVQAAYHLNRWYDSQKVSGEWQVDPLVETLPQPFQKNALIVGADAPQFKSLDSEHLMESIWMRDLSGWVSASPVAGAFGEEMRKHADTLGPQAEDLIIAHRLFDWVIRGVQLDPLMPYPADPVSGPSASAERSRSIPPPMRAIRGPGYQYYPWQTLLLGHGDAWCRARVFTLLCRQRGIDVVILAFAGLTTPPRPREWTAAARIGEELYLFDCHLGMPIPGPGDTPIATLSQVVENPKLMSDLNVGEEFKYPFTSRDLRSVTALIDASPTSLFRRTQLLEKSLSGDDRVVLTVNPSELAQDLVDFKGITDVELWRVPYEAVWYQQAYVAQVKDNPQVAAMYYREFGLFNVRNNLLRGRYRHIRGEFDRQEDEDGAKLLYLNSRVPKARLDALETSEEVQAMFGLTRQPEEREVIHRNRLMATRAMLMESKLYASYWLGLAHFDTGDFKSCTEWLADRTLEATPDGPWTEGARYNLGRTLEAEGKLSEARSRYLLGKSPQQHGNLLRARFLRKFLASQEESDSQ